MWVEHHKLRISIFPLNDLSQENFLCFNHRVNDSCESSFIFGTFHWKHNIYTVHKMMSGHIILAGEPKQLKLFGKTTLLHLDVLVIQATLRFLFSLTFLFLQILILKFQNMGILI